MANVTFNVQSFLNAADTVSITIADTSTIAQLKTAINGQEAVPTAQMKLFLNNVLLANTSTLSSLGITNGSYLKTATTIAHLATREARQKAKLDLAALDRAAYGSRPSTYDINKLPNPYNGNIVDPDDGAATLTEGRPWSNAPPWTLPSGMSLHEPLEGSGTTSTSLDPTVPGSTYLSAAASGINAGFGVRGTTYDPGGNVASVPNSAVGIYREKYVGNMWSTYGAFSEFNIAWFSDPTHGPIGIDVYNYAGFGQRQDLTAENGYSLMWRGYVQAPSTGNYNMWTSGTDDDAAFWIGTAAVNPTYANMNAYASNNRVLSLNSFTLTGGQWYPIRMVFTEFGGWEQCQWFLQCITTSTLYGGPDLTWAYNSVTRGY